MSDEPAIDISVLRGFVPLNGLRPESLQQIHKRIVVESEKAGKFLFEIGSSNSDSYYVLDGAVDLIDKAGNALRTITGGTAEAQHRLAHQVPRKMSVRCATPVTYFRIDSSLLDVMLTWDQTGNLEVSEVNHQEHNEDSTDDWMTRLLQMKAFQRVPPANLQAMFMRLEEIQVEPGEVVIKQGEDGDFFYVMISGKALVMRESPNAKPIRLAELGSGACFGEEALISSAKRNATIKMMTPGTLMRLAKKDFDDLLNAPLARKVAREDADKMVRSGNSAWLDVRLPSEFKNAHIEGAQNIPLYMLRPRLATLKKDTTYIAYCDSERRSSVACFVLSQKGYECYLLKDGFTPEV